MLTRLYLRASTSEQDANRAEADLDAFARERGMRIAGRYRENESGAALRRPELFRLLADSEPGDILLTEQVDRLSRLTAPDWDRLKSEIRSRGVRVVALDLPTSHLLVSQDEFTSRMFEAMNGLMLDILAAVARKDYEDRRRRQKQGIEKAKAEGRYKGRREDQHRNEAIVAMLRKGQSWSSIIGATRCSRSTLARLAKRVPEADGHVSVETSAGATLSNAVRLMHR